MTASWMVRPHSRRNSERRSIRHRHPAGQPGWQWERLGSPSVCCGWRRASPARTANRIQPRSARVAHPAKREIRKPAPLQFTMKDMNGIDVKLASFKGKVILLNFWATWCGPCRAEIPALVDLQQQYPDQLVVLGVSIDDPLNKLKPYATEMHMNYPVLVGKDRQDVQ